MHNICGLRSRPLIRTVNYMDSVRPIEEGIPWYNDIKTQPPFELESRLMVFTLPPFWPITTSLNLNSLKAKNPLEP